MSCLDDLTEAKLNVLERQGRTEEYLALCKKEERHLRFALKLCDLKQTVEAVKYAKKHLTTAEEALQVARRLRGSRLVAEAIEIGEHGLKLKGPKAALAEWLGSAEEAQGRTKQALKSWLAAFPEHPLLETYKTFLQEHQIYFERRQPKLYKIKENKESMAPHNPQCLQIFKIGS